MVNITKSPLKNPKNKKKVMLELEKVFDALWDNKGKKLWQIPDNIKNMFLHKIDREDIRLINKYMALAFKKTQKLLTKVFEGGMVYFSLEDMGIKRTPSAYEQWLSVKERMKKTSTPSTQKTPRKAKTVGQKK